jgi:1-phosphofructokinase
MLTEINDKGDEVTRDKQIDLIETVRGLSKQVKIAVMSGSLPKGVSPDFYSEVLSVIPKDVIKILDTEKENMEKALSVGDIFMVKPNLRELEQFSGTLLSDKKDIVKASRKYIDKGVKYVLVSLGADGAILTDGNEHYYCKSANVAINSTVGAGDSMVAAASVMIEQGESKAEILKNAVAAGTASITTPGTNLFYRDKFEEIYGKISVVKI